VLAALGTDTHETEAETIRAHVGAILMSEAMHDLRLIRLLLTPKK